MFNRDLPQRPPTGAYVRALPTCIYLFKNGILFLFHPHAGKPAPYRYDGRLSFFLFAYKSMCSWGTTFQPCGPSCCPSHPQNRPWYQYISVLCEVRLSPSTLVHYISEIRGGRHQASSSRLLSVARVQVGGGAGGGDLGARADPRRSAGRHAHRRRRHGAHRAGRRGGATKKECAPPAVCSGVVSD